MTSPQKENGYTPIANEIMEALAKAMPGFTEGQIIFAVLRKTYGWHKKEDNLSITQLCQMTGKSRRMVIYAIQNLEAKKMITIKRNFQQINKISFQKHYTKWLVQEVAPAYKKALELKKKASARSCTSATDGKKLVQDLVNDIPKVAPTKETTTKDTTTKDTHPVCDYFYKVFLEKKKQPYAANFARDGAIIKGLLKIFTLEQLKERIDMFFKLDDDFIKKTGHTIVTFNTRINSLVIKSESQWKAGHFV